jgi:peptidyl-prolyl cis-trans isomerase B (cyclophilin B)
VTPKFSVRHLVAMLALAALTSPLFGCAGQAPASSTPSSTPTSQSTSPTSDPNTAKGDTLYTPTYQPNGTEVAVIKTSKGTIKVALYGKDAPINAGNFIELAQKGFYNGIKFHRLEPGFVIQGGDPQTKDLASKAVRKLVADQAKGVYTQGEPMLGTGGPGYVIKGEFDPANVAHPHVDGTLAMARTDSPDSAGSQFYFTLGPQSFLDGKYTVFGDVKSGLDVVHKLEVGDEIESVTIENAAK